MITMFVFDVASRLSESIADLEGQPVWLALYTTKPNADGVGLEADFPGYERQEVQLARRSAYGGGLLSTHAVDFAVSGEGAPAYAMLVGAPSAEEGELRIGWGRLLGDPAEWGVTGVRIPAGHLQLRVG
jgi:hypothetical protein